MGEPACTAVTSYFIKLTNIYSHYASAIRIDYVSNAIEQANKFNFRFSGFPS
jgi:hypothetical protein